MGNNENDIAITEEFIAQCKMKRKTMVRGSLIQKKIKGNPYYYLVYREKDTVKTRYIKPNELEAIKQAISERKRLEEEQRAARYRLMQLRKACPRRKRSTPQASVAEAEPMDFMAAIQQNKMRFQQARTSMRPRREFREGTRRNPSEAKALARAVYVAVKRASESGYITRSEEGQEIVWKVVIS